MTSPSLGGEIQIHPIGRRDTQKVYIMGSQWEDKSKPHLNIVFVGHVDHGKSTTVGRLLLDSDLIEALVIE